MGTCSGCDFHIASDGNFNQKHNIVSGDCPPFTYQPSYLVPDTFVNAVGADLDDARRRPPARYTGEVPEDVIKTCESSHTAGSGARVKAGGDYHDDKGLMALLCRHDVPLYVCNIDTPGEQQKFFFALAIWFWLHIPDDSTIAAFYDVGCVSSRTAQLVRTRVTTARDPAHVMKYRILPEVLDKNLIFVTPAMHSYAHQWACQIVFGPPSKAGIGLTDGEGVERLWSRLRYLITTSRHSHVRSKKPHTRL